MANQSMKRYWTVSSQWVLMKRPRATALTLQTLGGWEQWRLSLTDGEDSHLEQRLAASYKSVCMLATCPAISLFGVYVGVQNLCAHRNWVFTAVSSTGSNSSKWEKLNVLHSDQGVLQNTENQWTVKPWRSKTSLNKINQRALGHSNISMWSLSF